jgi:hypothetical protein
MGKVVSPTHSLPVQLAGENPPEARDDFFSQFSGVFGFYSRPEHEALSWLGGEAGPRVVLNSGGFENNIPPCSVSWCGSTPLIFVGTFFPIQYGFSPSSTMTNFSWSFPNPTVIFLPSPNSGWKGVFSEVFPGAVLVESTLENANWFSLEQGPALDYYYPFVNQGYLSEPPKESVEGFIASNLRPSSNE